MEVIELWLLSKADAEIFVKVTCITKLNGTSVLGGSRVYEVTGKAEHSCIPNCEAVCADATGFLMACARSGLCSKETS